MTGPRPAGATMLRLWKYLTCCAWVKVRWLDFGGWTCPKCGTYHELW